MKRILISIVSLLAALLSEGRALAGGPYQFYTLTPCRLVDTRFAPWGSPIPTNTPRFFNIKGVCGVPTDAKAVALTVTATQSNPYGGHITVFPGDVAVPNASTINFRPNEDIANGAIIPLAASATNDLGVFVGGPVGSTVHVIFDVGGYYK